MKAPILFLVFNRPDTTKKVFESIRSAKPLRLYIAADGPRSNRSDDTTKCDEVRKVVGNIDWPCEVKTLFRDTNLGCKYAVSSAISWFFENEEMGIIIEDDVLPNDDFFTFTEAMLNRYRDDSRVAMVTGTNYLSNHIKDPYFFSEHMTIWGWGTWRRSWKQYELEMESWKNKNNQNYLKRKFSGGYIWRHYRNAFNKIINNEIDTWDIQWVYACLINSSLCVTPNVNLISNIGVEGTHVNGITDSHFMKKFSLNKMDLEWYSPNIHVNFEYDLYLHRIKTIKSVFYEEMYTFLKYVYIYKFLRFVKRGLLAFLLGRK